MKLVGVRGFEPPASTSRTWRSTRLRSTIAYLINELHNSLSNLTALIFGVEEQMKSKE